MKEITLAHLLLHPIVTQMSPPLSQIRKRKKEKILIANIYGCLKTFWNLVVSKTLENIS